MTNYYETKSQPITRVMVWQAYKKVRQNKGSSGIDGQTWADLEKNLPGHLYKLWNRLTSGSYFPQPVKQVEIGKKGGGVRKLGIPTLLDRIAQQVAKHHLEKQLEPLFHESSFGYRPGRSAHDAVAQSQRHCFGHDFVVDLDIQGYFDTIDHTLLMTALQHYCKDEWIWLYVKRWLQAGIFDGQRVLASPEGTPQGGVISPLLSNLFLHVVFDKWMDKNYPGKPFERYADDIVVHCKTERQAHYMLMKIRKRMAACGLTLHPVKTQIVNLRGISRSKYPRKYDFLGFTIKPVLRITKTKAMLLPGTFVSTRSKKAIREKFRAMQLHKWRTSLAELAKALNPVIEGMIQYFHKFWNAGMWEVWNQLNNRLLKWVKWEKGLNKYAAIRWLRQQYRNHPGLFAHWKLVQP